MFLFFAEANPLRQRQLGAPVDGVRLPAHVGPPGVRSAFAAAAGLLLAAEGPADLRPAGADVDVGDSAIAADGREESLGLEQVPREDGAGQTLRHVVVQANGLVDFGSTRSLTL